MTTSKCTRLSARTTQRCVPPARHRPVCNTALLCSTFTLKRTNSDVHYERQFAVYKEGLAHRGAIARMTLLCYRSKCVTSRRENWTETELKENKTGRKIIKQKHKKKENREGKTENKNEIGKRKIRGWTRQCLSLENYICVTRHSA